MDTNIQKHLAFVRTAECGSFTKAAQLLNYSQSGISRMIHDLEEEWNITLLERGRGGVTLTSDGLKLLPFAQEMVREYERLQQEVDALNGLHSGFIRIGTFSSVATHWLPQMIREFQLRYPGIDFELLMGDYGEIQEWILSGRVDCGFLRLPVPEELEATFLLRDRLLAILPEGHPLAETAAVPVEALAQEPFLLLEKGGKSEISEIFERHDLSPRIHCTTWDDYAIMSMVEQGLGLSILPEFILRRAPYRIIAKELDVPAYRDICIALRKGKPASLAVKRFLEHLPL